jgi:Calcineurin-like phosphoesterase
MLSRRWFGLRAGGLGLGVVLLGVVLAGAPRPGAGESLNRRPDTAGCPERPVAYLLPGTEPAGNRDQEALAAAGFEVRPLPLDRSPFDLRGLVYIGAGASTRSGYSSYMRQHAAALYGFVDRGNVLVQLSQATVVESTPPFLPTTHIARREMDRQVPVQVLVPRSPLLDGLTGAGALPAKLEGPIDLFGSQGGFEVSVSADGSGGRPLLMEGAYGQGRIVLSALPLDERLAGRFARNLRRHTIDVCRRQTAALKLTPASAAPAFVKGSWTLAVLPDTQVYSVVYPGLFSAQTAWVATHARRMNIRYAIHLGDIVNNNTALEWQRAADAMSLLDAVVPYALVPGNHDYGPSGDASSRRTLLNEYFPFAHASRWPSFGGAYQPGRLDNTYHLFSAGGREFIIIALEWAPRDEVVMWANRVMRENAGRLGILVTHAYLNQDGRRDDISDRRFPQPFNPHNYATPGQTNDGQQLWDKLVRRHPFILVLNGHALGDGTGYLVSTTDGGTQCHQLLSNYQMNHLGGAGYLRLLEFLPDRNTVRVHSYSPLYDRYLWDADQAFSFTLDRPVVSAVAGGARSRTR